MAFTDDFTGTNGQLLSQRTGWTHVLGQDSLVVQDGLIKKTTGTVDFRHAYVTEAEGGTEQEVRADFGSQLNSVGIFVFGGFEDSLYRAYALRPSSSNQLRLTRLDSEPVGADYGTVLVNLTNQNPPYDDLRLRGVVNSSGNTELSILRGDIEVGSYVDSSSGRLTTGRRGIMAFATGSISTGLDNYWDNSIPDEPDPEPEPDYRSIVASNSNGITVTLTKAQLATLRVRSGSYDPGEAYEPVSVRWARQEGDTTGNPIDGINLKLNIAEP